MNRLNSDFNNEIISKYTVEEALEDGVLVKLPDHLNSARFGKLILTAGISDSINEDPGFAKFVLESLKKYNLHDWGEMDQEDLQSNEEALVKGERIFAVYILPDNNTKIWVITEWDRSVTTVLYPSEY